MAAIREPRPVLNAPHSGTPIRTPLFILGIALALVAFLVMFAFGLFFVRGSGSAAQVRVVVAARDIQAREPLTPDMLTLANVPSAGLAPKTYAKASDLTGFAAVVPISRGEPISANLVSSEPDQLSPVAQSYLPIPAGDVAMTLPTSEEQGVAGYIAQGDYIDVIASVNTAVFSATNPRSVARTVFTRLYVIRVGAQSAVPRQGQPQGVASSITVLLTLCDAQYMEWLLGNATLKYVLLSYHDYGGPTPAAPASCASTVEPPLVGPAQVQARWNFTG